MIMDHKNKDHAERTEDVLFCIIVAGIIIFVGGLGILHVLDLEWIAQARYVQNERIYISALSMPHLQPYLEVGYGIGTHIFDVGVFVSSENWKFGGIGCKFTFELFNR